MPKQITSQIHCPKFEKCNAPICPIDPDWRKRKHLPEDRVCFYMMEHSKIGSKAVFGCASLGDLHQAISEVIKTIREAYFHVDRACIRASNSGSRMNRKIGGKL